MNTRVPPAPGRDRRHRRHSPRTIKLVQDMAAAGWTPTQLRGYLADRGIHASESTVRRWTIPAEQEAQRAANREAMRRRRDEQRAWEKRMRELRGTVGLSCAAISKLLRHDLGVELSEQQVRHRLADMEKAA